MLARYQSAALVGIDAFPIQVEVGLLSGLHSFHIVGLPDKAVSEARQRVSLAIKNSGAKPPTKFNKKIVVNLAPADLRKEGSTFDLAIALGFLEASDQIKPIKQKALFVGELGLTGQLRAVPGALPIVLRARDDRFDAVFLPEENIAEVKYVAGITIYPANHLQDVISHVEGRTNLPALLPSLISSHAPSHNESPSIFSLIKGHSIAKRALAITAAGGHNILFHGPPGTGKTLLAQSLTHLLPQLPFEAALEVTKIYSASGFLKQQGESFITHAPFRSPHHTASPIAILGGGPNPRPGEISLAHRGILFLDELPEFPRAVLEGLREPLETGRVVIARVKRVITFPSRFILVGAMNPCPCGFYQDQRRECRCSLADIRRYSKKISGPLLDRFDLFLEIPRIPLSEAFSESREVDIATLQEAITTAHQIQQRRFREHAILLNSAMGPKEIKRHCPVSRDAEVFLTNSAENLHLSMRGLHRVLKVSRTIADLQGKDKIETYHISEALQYRNRDTNGSNQ